MIRIAIVEDESSYVSILEGYIKRFQEENQVSFQTSVFGDGLDIVSDYTADYDIILLDIQMKHLNGMETAEKIRSFDQDVILIFITSTVQFAVQGYAVEALGYVLKPVLYLAFEKILSKAVKQVLKKQSHDYLTFDVEGGRIHLDVSQIYYIESQRHNILIHSEKGDFITAGPMKKTEAVLISKGFSKCHNAYLVNLVHVIGVVQNTVLLSEKSELPISRARKKNFMKELNEFVGGVN